MGMRYNIVTFIIAAGVAIGAMMLAEPPLEDEPGWDCATMGNMICGKV